MNLTYKNLYMKHERKFRRAFGVSMRPYMDFALGFDVVKFGDFLQVPDETSTANFIMDKYGPEIYNMVVELVEA